MARRLYALQAWLVRALIPEHMMGSYLLYRQERPSYAGRSDRNLRRRLIAHAYQARADYFDFDVHPNAVTAFHIECAHYHGLQGQTENQVHSASPWGFGSDCFICQAVSDQGRSS